jgi:uncharacterized protein YecT (DUF1311 family)
MHACGVHPEGTVKPQVILLFCLLPSPSAFAGFARLPLDMVASQSAAVVDATILSAKSAGYTYRKETGVCGHVYEARVEESLKGRLAGVITFAADEAMAPQSRHLLFLGSYDGDFPRDVYVSVEDPDDPHYDTNIRKARAKCLARLPRLKSTHLYGGVFEPSWDLRSQFVDISYWLMVPPELQPVRFEVRQAELGGVPLEEVLDMDNKARAPTPRLKGYKAERRFVPWAALREWLQRAVADLVDTSRPQARCNNACIRRELAAAASAMDRNLQSARRWQSGEPAALAAIEASQGAWEAYMKAACRSTSMALRDTPAASPRIRECPLWFTTERARELWLMRLGATCEYELEDCDDRSLQEGVAEVASSIQHDVDLYRRDFTGSSGILAAIDDDQRAWDAYLQANCRAVAVAWNESASQGPRMRSCWLRFADRRHHEMYLQYELDR